MKWLVVLGLVLLITPGDSEERTIEDKPMVDDYLRDESLDKFRQIVMPSLLDRSLLRNAARRRRSPADHHGHKNLVENILQDIHKGHLTQEKVDHWWKEIQTALNEGEISMNDVHTLIDALSSSTEKREGCCWFG